MKKTILILLGGVLCMTALPGCGLSKSRADIEELFNGFISLYPTSNLMEFYDMDGDRDEDFDENDKGTWVIHTSINKKQDVDLETRILYSEGMRLWFNRNTRQTTGHYYVRTDSIDGITKVEYPVYYDETGIHLVEDIENEELKNKILNFKFLIECVSFEDGYIQLLPLLEKRYNAEVPLYDLMYELEATDKNIQSIKEQYNITTDFEDKPRLNFEGDGRKEWGSHSKRRLIFLFDQNRSVYIDGSISFVRSEGMR